MQRFWLGIDPVVHATLKSDYVTDRRVVGGSGLQLRFGWGFNDKLGMSMDVAVTKLDVADSARYLLANGDVVVRYTPFTFPLYGRAIAPFLTGGVNLRDVSAEGRSPTGTRIYALEGEVASFGAGVDVFLTPSLSATLVYHAGIGDFTDERVGNVTTHNRDKSGESHRVSLGITLHGQRQVSP